MGTVTDDDDGRPLDQICVTAENQNTLDTFFDPTGGDGTYPVADLPDGDYKVRFSDCTGTYTYIAEYYDDATSEFEASPGRDGRRWRHHHRRECRVYRRRPLITGTVTADDDGEPIDGVAVSARDDDFNGAVDVTDEDGEYDIGGLATDEYTVGAPTAATGSTSAVLRRHRYQ